MQVPGILTFLTLIAAAALAQAEHNANNTTRPSSASTYWYANIPHGTGPNAPFSKKWTVFRNVRDHGAKGDGVTDDTIAIRLAMAIGDNMVAARGSGWWGSTGQPAVIYFPPGTYLVTSTIKNLIGTVWMGDPTDRPIIKARKDFSGSNMISGVDKNYPGLVAFYHEMKNLVFDSTAVAATANFTLLDWAVSQGCQLSNSVFVMRDGANGHVAIRAEGTSSPLLLNDLEIRGGGTGYTGASTQHHFKNVHFKNVLTGIRPTNTVQYMVQACRFDNVTVGVDMSGGSLGLLSIIDTTAVNTETLVKTDSNVAGARGSIVLENIVVDGTVPVTVKASSKALLTGSVSPGNTWIRGNVYSGTSPSATLQQSNGEMFKTSRPLDLVNGTGFYHTVTPPTYASFATDQVINVREVTGYPVAGDSETDDSRSLQAILDLAAATNKVAFFPHGTYILANTLIIPPNSRLWGESFTELSGSGPLFKDAKNPKPVIRVGQPGDIGIAQFTDFVFTVEDLLPGAILLEVNMAGTKPGDVGFFNTHFRIGGAQTTPKVNTCKTNAECKAVHIAAHLTETSSSYWENSWAWSAEHDLDGGGYGFAEDPAPAGGFLIEATKGTWMLGWGVEHFVLYQVTIRNSKNVFVGMQQGEASYYQGVGNSLLAPRPWENDLLGSDPGFEWCGVDAAACRMSIYQRVVNSTSINLYNGGYWNFVSGPNQTFCNTDCQDNAVFYENNTKLFAYGISTINNANLIVETGPGGNEYVAVAKRTENEGVVKDIFQSGTVAAYLRQSS